MAVVSPMEKKDKKKEQFRPLQNIIRAIYSKMTMFGEKNEIYLKDKRAEGQAKPRNLPSS